MADLQGRSRRSHDRCAFKSAACNSPRCCKSRRRMTHSVRSGAPMSVGSSQHSSEIVRPNDWQAPPSSSGFAPVAATGSSKRMRVARRIGWNLLPPLTFVAIVGAVVGRGRGLQDSRVSAARSRRRVRAPGHRRADAVDALAGDADRDPARLRPDGGDRDPARPRHRAVAAGEAARLSAADADAARAEDRGRAAVPRVARLRHGIEGAADGADDVLPAAAREHQRIPDPRRPLAVSDAIDGRDRAGRRFAICAFPRRCR